VGENSNAHQVTAGLALKGRHACSLQFAIVGAVQLRREPVQLNEAPVGGWVDENLYRSRNAQQVTARAGVAV